MWNHDHLRTKSSFFSHAEQLRAFYDHQFNDPMKTHSKRFVWDYWSVPRKFRAIRTLAYEYFPKLIYRDFHEQLRNWGRENLGCHDISPPWMSYYVDGCYQSTHRDAPHGPWAFVYSLTRWNLRAFTGGETFLGSRHLELIPSRFNQLTVFNPSIPHGVKRVRGTEDPREARLVIHGWFVNPRPFISGPLRERHLQEKLDELGFWLQHEHVTARGACAYRIQVNTSGRVSQVKPLWNRVESSDKDFKMKWMNQMRAWNFGRQKRSSALTLPFEFE